MRPPSTQQQRSARWTATLTALTLLWTAFCGPVLAADPKPVRIGVIKIVSHAALDADEKGFEAALASAGFKEGVNVVYDRQNAKGDPARAQAIAQKFVNDKVDLIHSIATPSTQAVLQKTGLRIDDLDVVEAGLSAALGPAALHEHLDALLERTVACAADCVAATAGFGMAELFWCAGCQGTMYPLNGNVSATIGHVQASRLALARFSYKLHRELVAWGTMGSKGLCGKYLMPVMRKQQYRLQNNNVA